MENTHSFSSGKYILVHLFFTLICRRVLSVFVNSVYSFWWDVTNDWGLTLLKLPFSLLKRRRRPSTPAHLSPHPLKSVSFDADHEGSPGLRSQLLFNPTIYYIAIFVNFVLRFTWSLKLSPHLHHVADLEAGVFMIEALEVLRRWIWVFIRVEWEVLKLGRERENGEEYEFLMREAGETDASDM
jgi:EXS family